MPPANAEEPEAVKSGCRDASDHANCNLMPPFSLATLALVEGTTLDGTASWNCMLVSKARLLINMYFAKRSCAFIKRTARASCWEEQVHCPSALHSFARESPKCSTGRRRARTCGLSLTGLGRLMPTGGNMLPDCSPASSPPSFCFWLGF